MDIKTTQQKIKKFIQRRWYSKFTIATICFLVWVLVFDKYNFATHRNLSNSIENLENEKIDLEGKIVETRIQLKDLDLHKERYAREHYFMHKPNEEIIVINVEDN